MPYSSPVICPRCHSIKQSNTKCKICSREYNKAYNKEQRDMETYREVYSTTRWRLVRDLAMTRAKGLCEICYENGIIEKGVICDHIVPIKANDELTWDLSNLRILCRSCHNKVTAEQNKEYGL